ncbi:MAG TPA: non-heme iron oxygenase ferredoxin subunit [Dermatophilaceae bacterium]|nr:non-heme iron oxygenase ferredoxin subunit [Dermatophilaceae bacterium]
MTFERVCTLSDLTVGEAALAIIDGVRVAMVRDKNGHVHAVADECSHGKVSLSEGDVDGCYLECWLHGSKFDLNTGRPVTPPALTPVAVYPVRVENDEILVSVTAAAMPTDVPVNAPAAVPTER